tara:strand:+ start:952 stop:1470 length:519 start_codon:yes stop_codon:yes gene_type:complete
MEKLIIKDNFLKNPDEIREIALCTPYNTPEKMPKNVGWKGFRSNELESLDNSILNKTCKHLTSYLHNNFEMDDLKVYYYFHVTLNDTKKTLVNFKKDRWHRDFSKYAGLIYLSPNPPEDTGTTIVIDGTPLEVENYYNRIMAYPAHYYHAPTDLFGNDMKSGRLTLTFFVDT